MFTTLVAVIAALVLGHLAPAPMAVFSMSQKARISTPSAIFTPGPNTTLGKIVTSRPISVS